MLPLEYYRSASLVRLNTGPDSRRARVVAVEVHPLLLMRHARCVRWSSEAVDVEGCRLAVSLRRGDKAVAILHGQLGVGSIFRPFAEALSEATVVIPDLRGRGGSVCYDEHAYSWSRLVDDVIAMLDFIGAGPAVLVGASMGAGLAVATATRHPERVDALVLWATPYAGTRSGWDERQRRAMEATFEFARDVQAVGLDGAIARRRERDPNTDHTALRSRWLRHDPRSLAAALLGLGWAQPIEDIEDLATISAPTAVAPGNDDLHPRRLSERYIEAIPTAQRVDGTPDDFARFISSVRR